MAELGASSGAWGALVAVWGRLIPLPGLGAQAGWRNPGCGPPWCLRHNLGTCTPEMGSHQINRGWAEPGCRGVLGVLVPSSSEQEGRVLPLPPIALLGLHHSAATSGVQVGAGQKVSWIHDTPTLPGSTGRRGGSASVARHD